MLDEHMGPIKKYSILTVGAVVLALANYVFKFPNHFSFGVNTQRGGVKCRPISI